MPDMVAKLKLEIDKSSADGLIGKMQDTMKAETGKMEKTPDLVAKAMVQAQKEVQRDFFRGLVKEQKEIIKPTGGKGAMGGIFGDMMGGGITKLLGPLAIIAGGIAMLVKSSALLQNVLKTIGRLIMFALKPLGDILGVALMPLLYIMKPIGQFFNMLMKPYIRKAMAAMRAGGALMKEGKYQEATGAFALGAGYLIKPFLDLTVKANTEIVAGFADLLSAIPIIGTAFTGMGEVIRSGGQNFIDTTTNIMDNQLGTLLAQTESMTGKYMGNVVLRLKDTEVLTGYITEDMRDGIIGPLTQAYNWIIGTWGPDFVTSGKNIFDELKRVAISSATKPVMFFGKPIVVSKSWRPTGRETEEEGGMTRTPRVNVSSTYNITSGTNTNDVERIIKSWQDNAYNELRSKLGG